VFSQARIFCEHLSTLAFCSRSGTNYSNSPFSKHFRRYGSEHTRLYITTSLFILALSASVITQFVLRYIFAVFGQTAYWRENPVQKYALRGQASNYLYFAVFLQHRRSAGWIQSDESSLFPTHSPACCVRSRAVSCLVPGTSSTTSKTSDLQKSRCFSQNLSIAFHNTSSHIT
jgi:hypothetical protein